MEDLSKKAPKPATIEQDIAAMIQETGTAMFSRDELQYLKFGKGLGYDYEKLIEGVSKAQKISPLEAEKKLIECKVLHLLPNGEYMIEMGQSTIGNLGRNYGGIVTFVRSKDDDTTQYHEMAHSYQILDDLFDEAKLDKMYEAAEKELGSTKNKTNKLSDRGTYKSYLKEVHSEIFAQMALMLRQESGLGFRAQALYAQSYGVGRNAEGTLESMISFGSRKQAKLYACKQAMIAAVNEVATIRKRGERADYFNPDGTLKAKKISKLCEKIVMDHAFTPRTYKLYRDGIKFNEFSASERKMLKEGGKTTMMLLPAFGVNILGKCGQAIGKFCKIPKKIANYIKQEALRTKGNLMLFSMSFRRKKSDNPRVQALNDYAYIQAKVLQRNSDLFSGMVKSMYNREVPSDELRKMSLMLISPNSLEQLTEIYSIIRENKDNTHFQRIVENVANIAEIRQEINKPTKKLRENPVMEISLSNQEKIATLRERIVEKQNNATNDINVPMQIQTSEQVKYATDTLQKLRLAQMRRAKGIGG